MLALHFFVFFFNWGYSPARSLIRLIGASCQHGGSSGNAWFWEKRVEVGIGLGISMDVAWLMLLKELHL